MCGVVSYVVISVVSRVDLKHVTHTYYMSMFYLNIYVVISVVSRIDLKHVTHTYYMSMFYLNISANKI